MREDSRVERGVYVCHERVLCLEVAFVDVSVILTVVDIIAVVFLVSRCGETGVYVDVD